MAATLAIAVLAGAVTYAISSRITPTYRSTAELRVTVNGSAGLGTDSLTAANDLTAQLVQVATTNAVLQSPAASLGMSVSQLASHVSVGSVSQQNVLAVSADATTAALARQRATAVARGLSSFLATDASAENATYSRPINEQISRLAQSLAKIVNQLRHSSGTRVTQLLQTQYSAVLGQEQALQAQLAQRNATGTPSVLEVEPPSLGAKVAPRPTLYAIVGAVVAGFIALQLLVLRRRSRD